MIDVISNIKHDGAREMWAVIMCGAVINHRLDRHPTYVFMDRDVCDGAGSVSAVCAYALLRTVTRPSWRDACARNRHVIAIGRDDFARDMPADRRYVVDGSAQSFAVACMSVTGRALKRAAMG